MPVALKAAIEALLLGGGPAALSRRRIAGRSLILAYHNILPEGATPGADTSLHLRVESFATQLDVLVEHCDVVPLADLTPANTAPPPKFKDRPRVAITFDDAYQGAVTTGVAELRLRSLPGTVFVAPEFIGGKPFWWDQIAPGALGPGERLRNLALMQCRGEDALVRQWAEDTGLELKESPYTARAATENELMVAMRYDRLTVGSHTWSHPNLTLMDTVRLDLEMKKPMAWLSERFQRVVNWVSYPYGLSSPAVEAAARRAGYEAGVLVRGGWIGKPQSSFAIPRFNVPAGLSKEGFALRLAGMFAS
jgi:peptidoglycan/xylan/chitin deacetylase (PgdA/CDA1 family)